MFTKPTGTPSLGFASKTTPVPANWFNYVSNNFPDIFDATGGGTWQNVGDIVFKSSSNKFKLNYPDINHKIELRGFVTFDLTDIGGMPTSVGGFTCNLETTFNSTVVFDGSGGVTFSTPVVFDTDGDITLQTGCAVTAQSGSSVTVQSGSSLTVNAGGTLQANGTTNVTNGMTLTGSIALSAPVAYTRGVTGIYAVTLDGVKWSMPVNGNYIQGTDVVTASPIVWRMDVPSSSTVTGVSVIVDPPAGHGGVLPTSTPTLAAYVVNPTTGTYTLIAGSNVSDPTLIATYENPHTFSTGALTGAVGEGEFVVVEVTGEYGGSALTGLSASPPSITFTRSKVGEE